MKRLVAIGGAVVLVGAGAWGGVWWAGRGEVALALDAGVDRLADHGWSVTWAGRRIGGFPFGYDLRLTDVVAIEKASGLAIRLPAATVETDGGRIIVHLPETFGADIPVPGPARAEDPALPPVMATKGQAENLVVALSGDGESTVADITADRASWHFDQPDFGSRLTQTVEGLEAELTSDRNGAGYTLHAGRIGIDAQEAGGGSAPTTFSASAEDVALTGKTSVGSAAALGEMLYAGGPGEAEQSGRTGPIRVRITGTGVTPGMLDWQAGSASGKAVLTSGHMRLQGQAQQNRWNLTPADPAAPIRGGLTADTLSATYEMPMAPAEKPSEMAIGLTLAGVTADEAAWAAIDPKGALPHDPATLTLDLGGMARVTSRIDKLEPGASPPFEVTHLTVEKASADALGASVEATGQVDILQPLGVPMGKIDVSLTGVQALIGALGRAGLITTGMMEQADAILQVYARPAEGQDAWTTDISFTTGGPLVNGMPVR